MDDHVETLRRYNRWRRGQDCEQMQDPRVVGAAIDEACDEIQRLRAVLREIADHHDHQRDVWATEAEDTDQAGYHEERRDFAMFHLSISERPGNGKAQP